MPLSVRILHSVPAVLTWMRVLLGPVLILLAWQWPHPAALAICLTAAFLSDVFDGIIARRLGIATANLRRFDSVADSIFYICAITSLWMLHPEVLSRHAVSLGTLLALEVVRYVYDLSKFGREASYHMWSSKLWGIALFAGCLSALAFGQDGVLVSAAIVIGIIADVEGLLISIVLNAWHHDVPSIVHALRLRKRSAN